MKNDMKDNNIKGAALRRLQKLQRMDKHPEPDGDEMADEPDGDEQPAPAPHAPHLTIMLGVGGPEGHHPYGKKGKRGPPHLSK